MNWYKATGPGGTAMFGTGTWNLPTADGPGEWMPRKYGQLIPCVKGYHVTDAAHVIDWLGPEMYLAEVDPGGVLIPGPDGDKWVTPTARLTKRLSWDENAAMQFIEDCDLHVSGLPTLYDGVAAKLDAQQCLVPGGIDRNWRMLDIFLADCRRFYAKFHILDCTSGSDDIALAIKHNREERLWQNQRLLMYLHGGIA